MSYTVNPELIALAQARFEKIAVVPGGDPAMGGGAPPMDPAAMGAAPPVDPAMAAAPAAPAGMAPPAGDPASAMAAMAPAGAAPAPAPMPPATPTGAAPGQQKLKPEQMMQMLDYRLYNMQQQLTAIMNALQVQVPPESLVLPPGTTGAPPAEAALPGGPMAPPPPQDGGAAAGGPPPGADPAAAAGMPMDPTKVAAWWLPKPESKQETRNLQAQMSALTALQRSLEQHAG